MNDLERRLTELATDVEYPATPPIAASVAQGLRAEERRRLRRPPRWGRLSLRTAVLAAALVVLAAAVATAAVPSLRHDLLELVGLRGVTVERVPALPKDVRRHLGRVVGEPTTLEAAPDHLSFTPLVPSGLGEPNGVFVGRPDDRFGTTPPGGELTLTYPPRRGMPRSRYTGVGLLLDQIDGRLAPGTFGKLMPPSTGAERFWLDGDLALWIEGLHGFYRRLHGYYYKDSEHNFRGGRVRLSGNSLLVQRGPVLVRIEGEFGLAEAKAIARSLSPLAD